MVLQPQDGTRNTIGGNINNGIMSLFDNYTRKQKQVLKEQLVNQLFWSKLYEKEHDTNPDALMKKLKAMSFRKIVDKWEEDLRLITQKEYD